MALLHPFSCKSSMAPILLLIVLFHIAGVQSIGVCYGRNGDNLPDATTTINLYKSNGIRGLRLYEPDTNVFEALRGTNIDVILYVPNPSLQDLTDPAGARDWVQRNIVPYYPAVNFKYIAVGNEVYAKNSDTNQYVNYVLPALTNVHNALSDAGYNGRIKASTATFSAVLADTVPPSNSVFNADAAGVMNPVVGFLAQNNLPLLANIYPYFSHRDDPNNVPLPFALFTEPNQNSAGYRNLFDALLDSMYFAVQKAGGPNIPIIVSESGWPSDGGLAATTQNANTYYSNLISHVNGNSGTPMKPGTSIETFLFAMFDENVKRGDEVERHFGLFSPDKSPKYQLNFN
ncbi:PREDICTED: glucan endo-1,3-beta-glucosidase, acidic-like isoform X1 [Ipomoea nil]|uniref:glucan endo-1,3-beta-glucosidase, acidic-like isoform X1 n=1 Tax=Ipomoea nil TaxID=35883 RepID=UPI000901B125|nr:PREDICTED: glucan endo-1,3-beta-glucosidase, acidic-like isoform X1 [Ipomoea nil]